MCTGDEYFLYLLPVKDIKTFDIESLVESLPNRIKLGLAVSPKTLLKRENLTRIEKLRIVGDACFR